MLKEFYSVKELADSGLLPWKSRDKIRDLIETGKLKCFTTGTLNGTRHIISLESINNLRRELLGEKVEKK